MSKPRKKFEKIQAYGYIATTQQGALIASRIRLLDEGEFPTVFLKAESAQQYGIARMVRVTVEVTEDPAFPLNEEPHDHR